MRLDAGQGLFLEIADDGTTRVGWDADRDWFGPGSVTGAALNGRVGSGEPIAIESSDELGDYTSVTVADGDVRCTARAYAARPMAVFRIEATTELDGLAAGAFDRPAVGWPVFTPTDRAAEGAPAGMRALVFQHCEFGLPTTADAGLDGFFLLPHRPPTGWPLIVSAPDGRTLLLAPLEDFHEQTIGLNGGTVRCGWHGDLDSVPAGFATEMALIGGSGPRHCLDTWGALLLERAGTVRPGRWADALATRPSYWTDNGAAYWYRTEPGHDAAGSMVAAVEELRAEGVPVGAVQLDSWFYPHVDLRPFDTEEWTVPPSAMIAWEERDDVLPGGITNLRSRLGDPPLVTHIRHLSAYAPIAEELPVHVDGPYAAPATPAIYERWLDQCLAWGVETFEHDWLVEVFFGVGGLRERPGRAREWQEGIDRAARERGITLQWCMGTPADFARTTTLTQVTSVRTCGDHGYIATAGQLWAWFCTTNALARSLGLMPFKDVFRADPDVAGHNGEPEALLSALSTGPVGLGDRVGRSDPELALRTCRADGVLIKPHVPIAAVDRSMLSAPGFRNELLVAECYSEHSAGRWGYVLGLHANPGEDPVVGEIAFTDLGDSAPVGDVVVWDWRSRTATRTGPDTRWPVSLLKEEWTYLVLAPLLADGRLAVVGDASKFVTAGDARIEVDGTPDGARVTVKGAGETVTITGWSTSAPTAASSTTIGSTANRPTETSPAGTPRPDGKPPAAAEIPVTHDPTSGTWTVEVDVPPRGWTAIDIRT